MSNQKIFCQMILIIKRIVNWLTNNIRLVTIGIISLLTVTIFVLGGQLNKKNEEINRLSNNIQAYEQLVTNKEEINTTLQLTVKELTNSQDSLLQQLNAVRQELKIKNKNLKQAQVINTVIKDTVTKVITVDRNFNETLKINPLTTIKVSRTDSILTAKIDIQNQQILFIEEKKVYKNKYKNGWIRFWHFDWKKIRVRKYQIQNSNPLIRVTDTRVVEINN